MDNKTIYTHRVAIMETRSIIMDVEAPNDVDSIKEAALSAYFNEEGDQEVGYIAPTSVIIYPWLEEGQTPPEGSAYPEGTTLAVTALDFKATPDHEDDESLAQIIEFPK
jgi:hypothetical protein